MDIYRLAFAASLCLLISGCGKTGDPVPGEDETPVSDERIKEILVEFYDATDGPNWTEQPNWAEDRTIPLPLWDGVSFFPDGDSDSSIGFGLDFHGYGLRGEIPSGIFSINILTSLNLNRNELTGQIPDAIGDAKALADIRMDDNSLTGNIPASLSGLQHLMSFSVEDNKLSGKVPDEVVAMPYFYRFELEQSDGYGLEYPQPVEDLQEKAAFKAFYETLPEDVKKSCPWDGESPLSSTGFIVLDGKGHIVAMELIGEDSGQEVVLSDDFLELSHLRYLELYRMAVKSLPENFSRLASLELLMMYKTQLETFPKALMSMKNLRHLFLIYSRIDSIPDGIGEMSGLRSLSVYGSSLSGYISRNFTKIPLRYLEICRSSEEEELGGMPSYQISDFLEGPSTLNYLFLKRMCLEGELPGQLPSVMPDMYYLDLGNNNISGSVPASYAGMHHLLILDLYKNRMSGVLPQEILDSPYCQYWMLNWQQEGYGFTNLPDPEPEAMNSMSGGIRSADDIRAAVFRQAAIECGGAKFLDRR